MSDSIDNTVGKMKDIRLFTVEVEVPENKKIPGFIPMESEEKQNKGWFKVYALTMEEATEKVNEFIQKMQN